MHLIETANNNAPSAARESALQEKLRRKEERKRRRRNNKSIILLTVHRISNKKATTFWPWIRAKLSRALQGDMNDYRHENKQKTRAHKNSKPSQHWIDNKFVAYETLFPRCDCSAAAADDVSLFFFHEKC